MFPFPGAEDSACCRIIISNIRLVVQPCHLHICSYFTLAAAVQHSRPVAVVRELKAVPSVALIRWLL
ncbi:hypothetical protein BH20CHL1_BH20CHL1_06700 [soil metagenome]